MSVAGNALPSSWDRQHQGRADCRSTEGSSTALCPDHSRCYHRMVKEKEKGTYGAGVSVCRCGNAEEQQEEEEEGKEDMLCHHQEPHRKVTHFTHGCWGVHSRARPAQQQQGGPRPPPGKTLHQPTSSPSHKGAGQWRMFPTQIPCSCKPPAPPAQLAVLRHGQVAPTQLWPLPQECPGQKGMGSRGSPRAQHHLFPGSLRSDTPSSASPALTPGLRVMDSSVILGEELGLGPQCPRECQKP